jgi:hypothetical protein
METQSSMPEFPSPASQEVKETVQELLKHGHISSDTKPALFNKATRNHAEINAALTLLDLTVQLDELRGLAILCVAETTAAPDEGWNHPLVRRQRLTLEQSLLVAILRQAYVVQEQEAGVGIREVRLPLEDILPMLTNFLGDTGSDAKNHQRLSTLLDQLKPHGIVTEPDKNHEVTILPLITHLANPTTLTALLAHYRQLTAASQA